MPPKLLEVVWKRRVHVLVFVAVVGLAAAGVALVLPAWYRAQAAILPPQENGDAMSSIAGLIESSALGRVGLMSNATPSDVFKEILESRTLHESVIQHFNLATAYRSRGVERTLREFEHHLSVTVKTSGVIILQVEDHDPRKAAAMANFLVEELDRFNRETYNTRAKQTRIFLEGRIADTEAHLRQSATLLTEYEGKHGVVAEDQSAAAKGVGDALSRRMSLRIQRDYMSSYSRPDSPDLRELDAALSAIDQELGKLPPVKQEGARLAMEAEIQRKVFTLLTEQYEEARVQEQRDTPTLTVLDAAGVPEMRSRPRRGLIVMVSVLAATALAIGWVGYVERRELHA